MPQQLSSRAGRPLAVSRQPGSSRQSPHTFAVFGGSFRSAIFFPELANAVNGEASWTLELIEPQQLAPNGELLGALTDQPCRVDLHRAGSDGLVLAHSCTGVFNVRNAGREIRYAPKADAPADLVRGDVLGRVLPLAMYMQGMLSLHASAVALAEGAIGFLAPKGVGKSTISLCLAQLGARFVTDDVLPVAPNAPFSVSPGVQSVRLHDDSALRLIDRTAVTRAGIDGKRILDALPSAMLAADPIPLAALYVLAPLRTTENGSIVRRTRLQPREAVLELVRHAKIGALLGGSAAVHVLQHASRIAGCVPLYALHIARDLEQLPNAVATIASWHGGVTADTL